jgi:hypothetical protein
VVVGRDSFTYGDGHRDVIKDAPVIVDAITQEKVELSRHRMDKSIVEIFARSIRVGLGLAHYGFGLDVSANFSLKGTEMFVCPPEFCPCSREIGDVHAES